MGLLQRGEAFLNSKLGQAGAVAITYSRGPQSVSITAADESAWIGKKTYSSMRHDGARVQWADRDYLILASAISTFGEPQEGDTIVETINGTECTFKVLQPDTGTVAVENSDDLTRTRYRVHVKQVK